jgi:hypothetical protein
VRQLNPKFSRKRLRFTARVIRDAEGRHAPRGRGEWGGGNRDEEEPIPSQAFRYGRNFELGVVTGDTLMPLIRKGAGTK